MSKKNSVSCLLLITTAIVVGIGPIFSTKKEFSSTTEFRDWCRSHGLHVYPEGSVHAGPGEVRTSTTLSGAALAAVPVSPHIPSSAWRGVVAAVSADFVDPQEPTLDYRLWGRVLVYGDPDLLARLDALR